MNCMSLACPFARCASESRHGADGISTSTPRHLFGRQHVLVEGEIGDQALQAVVFVFELTQTPQFGHDQVPYCFFQM